MNGLPPGRKGGRRLRAPHSSHPSNVACAERFPVEPVIALERATSVPAERRVLVAKQGGTAEVTPFVLVMGGAFLRQKQRREGWS